MLCTAVNSEGGIVAYFTDTGTQLSAEATWAASFHVLPFLANSILEVVFMGAIEIGLFRRVLAVVAIATDWSCSTRAPGGVRD